MQSASMVGVGADPELSWVLRARSGDQEAFARLVDAYQVPVYNLAYRMLGNPAEAEDAAQETFLRAYTRLETYDVERKFSSWILSIAAHHCVDRLRRRGNVLPMEELPGGGQWLADQVPRPEDQALRSEQSRTIQRILGQLPAQYRLVIVLRYWQDLSYEEIATMTQSTESAVKSRLHRARQMMADILAQAQIADNASNRHEREVGEHVLSRCF